MRGDKLDGLARPRRGVVRLDDAGALGTTAEALRAHARRQRWGSPRAGVLLLPGVQRTFEQAVMVAVRAVGGDRVLVGRLAAAYLWGIVDRMPGEIELVVPVTAHHPDFDELRLTVQDHSRTRTLRARVWRSRTLRRDHATDIAGIPVTTPPRTLLDLAAVVSLDRLRSLVIDARQRRHLTLPELTTLHEGIRKYPGRPKMRRVLADLDEETCDSTLEWDFRKAARVRDLRPFPRPFPFRCSDGVVIEVDCAYPDSWVACECDGFGSHSDRAALTRDHVRQNRAVADGWRPFRVDWTRLKFDTDRLFAELSALLGSPHPHAGPPPMADPADVDARFRGRRR